MGAATPPGPAVMAPPTAQMSQMRVGAGGPPRSRRRPRALMTPAPLRPARSARRVQPASPRRTLTRWSRGRRATHGAHRAAGPAAGRGPRFRRHRPGSADDEAAPARTPSRERPPGGDIPRRCAAADDAPAEDRERRGRTAAAHRRRVPDVPRPDPAVDERDGAPPKAATMPISPQATRFEESGQARRASHRPRADPRPAHDPHAEPIRWDSRTQHGAAAHPPAASTSFIAVDRGCCNRDMHPR